MRRLYDHQLDAFLYTMRKKHPALFMRMRLGKTLVTIRRIKLYRPKGAHLRVLIVGPTSALGSWETELAEEGETDVVYLMGSRPQRLKILEEDHKWNLINKEGHLALPQIAKVPWDAVVLDESIFIKNPKAKVTKFFLRNFRKVPHRWILTGLPNPESSLDYICQILFLDPEFMKSKNYWEFRQKYFFPNPLRHEWYPHRGTEKAIAKHVGKRAFVLRRRDAGVSREKIYENRYLDFPSEVRKVYRKLEEDFILEFDDELLGDTMFKISQYTWLRRICGGFAQDKFLYSGKVNELVSLLTGELRDEQVIVWFCFNEEIILAFNALNDAKVSVGHLFGEHTREWREQERRRFQRGGCRVLLLQQAIAQMGMDLSAADTAIYYSEPLSLSARMQTEDRILNLKKDGSLLYIHLLVRDSVDVDIRKAMKGKDIRSNKSLNQALKENFIQRRRK